jgi:predicted CXXCH cytochrome family protein
MAKKLGNGMSWVSVLGIVATWFLVLVCSCSLSPTETFGMNASEQLGETDPLSVNAACYMCHMGFVKENISKTHLNKNITCISCHGLSAAHANDENVGATPPDVVFARSEVDIMCLRCHERHKIAAEKLAEQQSELVCTDCHGEHRIERSAG